MINKQKRLIKLLLSCDSYEQFERMAIKRSKWMLGPYVDDEHNVTRAWLKEFYKTNGGK